MRTYLNGSHVGVLGDIFILIETIFGGFTFAQVDTKFNETDHHRFQRGHRGASSSLGGDMFMENGESGRSLAHADKFCSPLWNQFFLSVHHSQSGRETGN